MGKIKKKLTWRNIPIFNRKYISTQSGAPIFQPAMLVPPKTPKNPPRPLSASCVASCRSWNLWRFPILAILYDLFGMVKWPFGKANRDLQQAMKRSQRITWMFELGFFRWFGFPCLVVQKNWALIFQSFLTQLIAVKGVYLTSKID